MLKRLKWVSLFLLLSSGMTPCKSITLSADDGVVLYTPYTKISVPPGESIDYGIDVINNSNEIRNVEISLAGIPKGWNYILKSGAWNISQISIMPGGKQSLSLRIEVPFKVDKGTYRLRVMAGSYSLPLTVIVSEQGTFKTEFTTSQPNMEGQAKASFIFNANLKNRTGDKQLYALTGSVPAGWNLAFKSNYQQVSSVNVDANGTQDITIEVKPPEGVLAGKYKIPVNASTSTTSASLDLEAVVTGSYNMELTTPTGLLSSNITAGDEKRLALLIRNTGSSELSDIKFDCSAPVNWDVTFDPKVITKLQPGSSANVSATIKADKKAIAGDYVATIESKTPEVSSKAAFRISVETPMLWGWVGVLIIIAAAGSVFYLFRKYGRR